MFSYRSAPLAVIVLAMAAGWAPLAHASGYSVIWKFRPAASGEPDGRLLLEGGALYGTASGGQSGHGTVFQLTRSGGVWGSKKLLGFKGANGAGPSAGLVQASDGSFYGTTQRGGSNNAGTVFRLVQSNGKWTQSVIHEFGTSGDGSSPSCDLVLDPSTTTLFGTTSEGGGEGEGTVFSLVNSNGAWKETVLYSFQGLEDGRQPLAGLYRDSSGALYGTASYAGAEGVGTLFELIKSHDAWKEHKLHDFANGSDGAVPSSQLIADSDGALFGTTYDGGVHGYGTVFKIVHAIGKWKETVLWSFAGGAGDGANPDDALYMDEAGTLYGTTGMGGSGGYGTLFALKESGGSWTETMLHSFAGGNDGEYPFAGLIADSSGNLYGTTIFGGKYGDGTAFELTP
jgi:uncharacterized repeat protein (TIGR03803 family)